MIWGKKVQIKDKLLVHLLKEVMNEMVEIKDYERRGIEARNKTYNPKCGTIESFKKSQKNIADWADDQWLIHNARKEAFEEMIKLIEENKL